MDPGLECESLGADAAEGGKTKKPCNHTGPCPFLRGLLGKLHPQPEATRALEKVHEQDTRMKASFRAQTQGLGSPTTLTPLLGSCFCLGLALLYSCPDSFLDSAFHWD